MSKPSASAVRDQPSGLRAELEELDDQLAGLIVHRLWITRFISASESDSEPSVGLCSASALDGAGILAQRQWADQAFLTDLLEPTVNRNKSSVMERENVC